MSNYKIETDRLVLRHFTLMDAEDMFKNWASDPRVCAHMTWTAHPNVEETKRVISLWLAEYEIGNNYQWGIVDKATEKLIGAIGAVGGNKRARSVMLGFGIAYDYWNKGIMTEAAKAVRDFFFDIEGFNRVGAGHDVRNVASGKVLIKIGMQYEGLKRQAIMNGSGELCDIAEYAILKSDRVVQ